MLERWATLLAALLMATGLPALDEPAIELGVDEQNLEIGDTVDLEIVYRWPPAYTPVTEPDPGPLLADVGIVAVDGPIAQETAEEQRVTWRAEILLESSGAWIAPRPALRFSGPEGVRVVRAPELILDVGTAGTPADLPPPRALWRPPARELEGGLPWWPFVLGAALVIGLAGLAWWLSRGRGEITIDPATVFAEELAAARRLAHGGDGEQAGIALETALRRYCGTRFAFDGLAATGREVVTRVGDRVPSGARSELRRLLDQFDALLWAPEALAAASVLPLAERSEAWVRDHEKRLAAERAALEAGRGGRNVGEGRPGSGAAA